MPYINLLYYHRLVDLIIDINVQQDIDKFIQTYNKDYKFHPLVKQDQQERLFICWIDPDKIAILYEDSFCSEIMLFFTIIGHKLRLSDYGNYRSYHAYKFYNGINRLGEDQKCINDNNIFLFTLLDKSGMELNRNYDYSYYFWLNFWNDILICQHKHNVINTLNTIFPYEISKYICEFFIEYNNLIFV